MNRFNHSMFTKLYSNKIKTFHPYNSYFESFSLKSNSRGTFMWVPNNDNKLFSSSITLKYDNNMIYEKILMNRFQEIDFISYELFMNFDKIDKLPENILLSLNNYKMIDSKVSYIING